MRLHFAITWLQISTYLYLSMHVFDCMFFNKWHVSRKNFQKTKKVKISYGHMTGVFKDPIKRLFDSLCV